MRKTIYLFLIASLFVFLNCILFAFSEKKEKLSSYEARTKPSQIIAIDSSHCVDSLWHHLYNSRRLRVYDSCLSITGVIKLIRAEKDGDYHIQVKLDSSYSYMLNAKNMQRQAGFLVVEIICANQVTQKDAYMACFKYSNSIIVPKIGDYVKIWGPYITDLEHGWNEIHPVMEIQKLK